jgi:hypothetical protein
VGQYVEAGQAASLRKGWLLVVEGEGFSEVGQDVALLTGMILATGEGTYLLSGIDAELLSSTSAEYILIADSGILSLFGLSAALRRNLASASQAYAAVARQREYEAQTRMSGFEAISRKRNYDA